MHTARFCDTWVICEGHKCAHEIARYVDEHGPIDGLHFRFVAESPAQLALERIPGLYYLAYNLWHRQPYRLARRLHAETPFDLVHQANVCGYREPGYLWRLDAPFIWGPVGGTQNCPWRFLGEAGLKGAASESIRSALNIAQLHLSARVHRAARRADALLVANSTIRRDLERALGVETATLVETGLSGRPCRAPRTPDDERPLRILWSGPIEPWKALSLLIKALALLPRDVRYELRILGGGSQEQRCQRLARDLGVEPHCTWLGWVPRQQAMHQYDWADVSAFTSLRDTTGTVVCEAVGAGLPVVCLDHQGVADLINDTCGIKVPVTTPREVIAGLCAAIMKLGRNRALCRELGEGALRRAGEYQWSYLAEQTIRIYSEILSCRAKRTSEERIGLKPQSGTGNGAQARSGQTSDARRVGAEAIRPLAKHAAARASLALHRVLGSGTGDSLGILLYHRIAEEPPGLPRLKYNVPPSRFREQLEGLLERGYQFWPLTRALQQHAAARPFPTRTVVLTFDDGYENVFSNAWPILRELNIPATVFLATAFLDREDPFPFDDWAMTHRRHVPAEVFRPIATDQCKELNKSSLIELAAHTHTHQDFRNQTQAFQSDLQKCIDISRRKFDLDQIAFAFPYGKPSRGYASRDLVGAAKLVGVTCSLTTEDVLVDPEADPFSWDRFNVYDFDAAATIAAKLSGWYSWAPKLGALLSAKDRQPNAAPLDGACGTQ